jgi:Holliday junction resolvase RusA-like endonuclease
MIILTIDGDPIPWKRAGVNWKNKTFYDQQKKEKEQVRWQLRDQYKENPLTVPLEVNIVCYFHIPESISRAKRSQMLAGIIHHDHDPDGDNLDGFYWDCMTGVIYKDDCQIFSHSTVKIYGTTPKTVITVRPHSSCMYTGYTDFTQEEI